MRRAEHFREAHIEFHWMVEMSHHCRRDALSIDDYAKDGGKELFTKMHCVL